MESVAQHLMWFVPMLWLGMVLAISFLEAPLKFRAPGVATELGLGIGRLVFRAVVVRPPLSRRSDRVLAGEELPRSGAHYWYIGSEIAKVIMLIGLAISATP
ncbi:hypothetical protein [Nocardia sp. NBC_00416]|uniref:hypothetical protein n=1 Tax=Nocardia sp. NBC_00416 TaxID=2975991 RepID=UPI002E1F0576